MATQEETPLGANALTWMEPTGPVDPFWPHLVSPETFSQHFVVGLRSQFLHGKFEGDPILSEARPFRLEEYADAQELE